MRRSDEPMQEIEALRARLSSLSRASLRITEDVDLDTVLREVLAEARSLTGAGRGAMTTLDDSERLEDFITSGVTEEEHDLLASLPDGPELFGYLSSLAEPLRVADFSSHIASVGLPELVPPLGPVKSFLGAPIRHTGRCLGNLYLSDKQGGMEFTEEDEKTLTMFAAQAAMAIANARRHRDERRAKADLETV